MSARRGAAAGLALVCIGTSLAVSTDLVDLSLRLPVAAPGVFRAAPALHRLGHPPFIVLAPADTAGEASVDVPAGVATLPTIEAPAVSASEDKAKDELEQREYADRQTAGSVVRSTAKARRPLEHAPTAQAREERDRLNDPSLVVWDSGDYGYLAGPPPTEDQF